MSRNRKAGGSVFGLALVSMLLFGAIAASGAQALAWHVGGKTLAERGEAKAPVTMKGGTLTLEIPSWGMTVACENTSSSGYLSGEDDGHGNFKATGCSIPETYCEADPIEMEIAYGLAQGEETEGGEIKAVETLTPDEWFIDLDFHGEECSWNGWQFTLQDKSGSMGAEANVPKSLRFLTGLPSYQAEMRLGINPVYVSLGGSLEQWYSNNPNLSLGAW